MTHTLFTLAEKTTVVLCPAHRADAMMWLWQEFEGAWTATVTGHAHCDACVPGANVPAGLSAAVQRQQAPSPAASRWTPPLHDVTLDQVTLDQVTLAQVTHADRTLPTLS